MCTRYVSPQAAALERQWHVGPHNPWRGAQAEVFPGYQGPFIRAVRDSTELARELVFGQWNLIPWFAKEPKQNFATCNARSEELTLKASYKHPWSRGQRCIIPAADDHPLMSRMHRPDLKRPSDKQDKRSVVAIELEDVDAWLYGTTHEASALLRVPAQEALDALPMPKTREMALF